MNLRKKIAVTIIFAVLVVISCDLQEKDVYSASDSLVSKALTAETPGLRYVLMDNSAYKVSKGTANTAGAVYIPDYHNSLPVTFIDDNGFKDCNTMTSIRLPSGLISIRPSAFRSCTALTTVTIPNSVTKIWDYAFFYCINLTSITLPNSIDRIPNYAFTMCTKLTTITIPEGVTYIGSSAFSTCMKLRNVSLPSTLKTIGYCAFYWTLLLENITIPNSVTYISNYAFSSTGITSLTIPDSVTSIGYNAFDDNNNLTNVTVNRETPPTVYTSIFSNCSNLSVIYVPAASVNAYKTAPGWNAYASIIMAIPLTPPVSVNATDNLYDKRVTITWPAVSDATHYNVYRMTYTPGTSPTTNFLYSPLSGWITATTYTDSNANPGVKYYYRIKAAGDANGNLASALSSAYDNGFSMLKSKIWYATDSCPRLDVWADVWNMGETPHWNQVQVYNTNTNASLGLLADYHTQNGSYGIYYPGSTAWPGSTYRYHGSYTQFKQLGLPQYIKARFENNTSAFVYSDMSNSLDLNTGRRNMAHKKPIILHNGNIGAPYAGPNDWLEMNDGDWTTNWFVWTNYPSENLKTKATIDLENACTIYSYRYSVFWDSNYGTTAQIRLKTSQDNVNWHTVSTLTVTNRQLIDTTLSTAINARYVQIEWVNDTNSFNIWNGWGGINELEVYGWNTN